MAFIERYVINENGAVTFTGNTLGLSRSGTTGVPGVVDSIGGYITTDITQQFGSYPPGTTNVFQNNSSSAVLSFPTGSTVLYAELIWGGTYIDNGEDNSAFINDAVNFISPAGSNAVLPDPTTSFEVLLSTASGFPNTFAYVRSADVTDLVFAGGAGTYTTGGVVGTLSIPDPTSNNAGWTLGVVYQNASLPLRNLSLRVTADVIRSTSGPVSVVVNGFATPFTGPLSGRALFGAQEGDANKSGDQALFGPTSSSQTALSGPNNFSTNFFASQINGDDGTLNTLGTFGNRNQINGTPGTNIVGGRQGWDITNVDISSTLVNTQTSAVLTLTTSGDGYLVNSNAIQVAINMPAITVIKNSDHAEAIVGDTITYTVDVENTSLSDATSVMFFDNIPDGSTFIMNSVTVDGIAQPDSDPTTGVFLNVIAANTMVTVTFQVEVTSLPVPPRLFDQAKIGYTAPTVPGGPVITNMVPSNAVVIPIYQPSVTITKSANSANALIGDTVTYTLTVLNTGNIDAFTTVTDSIPAGSNFVTGSVTVNGLSEPAASPETGISVGNISPDNSVTVTFQVIVVGIPRGFILTNQSTTTFTAQLPDERIIQGSATSNPVYIPVSTPEIHVAKTANVPDAIVGDTITYTVVVTNADSENANNLIFYDAISPGSVFISGSLTLNGVVQPAADPSIGVQIGTLAPGASDTITFSTIVVALPNPPQLTDQAELTFTSGPFEVSSFSEPLVIPVYQPIITTVKTVAPSFTVVGQTINYQFTVRNTGNIAALATLTDTIDPNASFVPGSVLINNISQPAADPSIGIPLGSLVPGGVIQVEFQVTVNTLPLTQQISNQGITSYTFTPPDGRIIPGTSPSNEVIIPISAPNLTVNKVANATDAVEGDIITYTLSILNNDEDPVTSVILTDPIPAGSVFIPGSVIVDGIAVSGADPSKGVSIGTIPANGQSILSFQVSVTSLSPPIPSRFFLTNQASVSFTSGTFNDISLSNIVNIRVYQPYIRSVKSASQAAATVGDLITYFITVSNTGNFNADVILTDPLPNGQTFIPNSVLINGNHWSGANPVTGIHIGTVQPGFPITVTFVTRVIDLPNPPLLTNQATANYTFNPPDGRVIPGSVTSNTVTIPVNADNIITVTKSTDAIDAVANDSITYSILIQNNEPTPITNIILTDFVPSGTLFIPGSAELNGVALPSADPAAGIAVGEIDAFDAATVVFQVKVSDSIPPLPVSLILSNQAIVNFTSGVFTAVALSNIFNTPVYLPAIVIVKSSSSSTTQIGGIVQYHFNVTNKGNIAANVTLTDPIPTGSTFAAGSVIVNGISFSEADPAAGIPLGNIQPGTTILVIFSVQVTSSISNTNLVNQATGNFTYQPPDGRVLTGTTVSNVVTVPVIDPDIIVTKQADKQQASLGEIITYTINIANSEATTNLINVTDPIPQGTRFVTNSVTIGGVSAPNMNPASGIIIAALAPGQTTTITFQVLVISTPTSGFIMNQAIAVYTPVQGGTSETTQSNPVRIPVRTPPIAIRKSIIQNEFSVEVGSILGYNITIQNTSQLPLIDTLLTDILQAESTLLPNSITVNHTYLENVDVELGLALGTIAVGSTVTLQFNVIVNKLPASQKLVNQAILSFQFLLYEGTKIPSSLASNKTIISVTESEE
ncbi:hypothetical protein GCM10008018_17910 [Paenibacillus marchantiophytorum]|uniref:DUF11 domain-containing protein n=1 Tax=Paenibacillus marchantiophytorum TaxID=1619310 RepID=A0ABQ2BV53_9BACL|nr:DUF11 domain-containing protein [Paenibacillus marchantiophytorum]GGI46601.1 hypothetical protein GCM10008018_17910 [Paenibacillus marchantiophytorum]